MFCNQQQPDLWQDRFDSWVVKCATSLFNLLCSNVVKRLQIIVTRFTEPSEVICSQCLAREGGKGGVDGLLIRILC